MVDVRRLPVGEDNEIAVTLDDLAREGARRMIAAALRAEADEYVASFVDEVDEDGRRLVVRNGHARERRVTVGSGTVGHRRSLRRFPPSNVAGRVGPNPVTSDLTNGLV